MGGVYWICIWILPAWKHHNGQCYWTLESVGGEKSSPAQHWNHRCFTLLLWQHHPATSPGRSRSTYHRPPSLHCMYIISFCWGSEFLNKVSRLAQQRDGWPDIKIFPADYFLWLLLSIFRVENTCTPLQDCKLLMFMGNMLIVWQLLLQGVTVACVDEFYFAPSSTINSVYFTHNITSQLLHIFIWLMLSVYLFPYFGTVFIELFSFWSVFYRL